MEREFLNKSLKALEKGFLNLFEQNFIEGIKNWDDGKLSKLTTKQYEILRTIAGKYNV